MATERAHCDPRVAAQASVLRAWGQAWRRAHGTSQQDLGRAAGYGSDDSPKSAAVAISRIEAGKTEPTGRYRQRLLDVLGHSEDQLRDATDREVAGRPRQGPWARVMTGAVHAENDVRRARIVAASNALTQRVAFESRTAEQVFERARNEFVLPFLEYAARVDWGPLLDARADDQAQVATSPTMRVRDLREQTRLGLLRTVNEGGARAGSGSGAGTAAGVFAAVSAAATASTGTAIASLSGAAASSATLAWLGGGSLAAGGMGLAGGTAVLSGVVALPALLALGAVLVWKGRRLRREAEDEAEKLDAAQQALEAMAEAVERATLWNDAQQDVIDFAGLIGRTIHARLVMPAPASGPAGPDGRIPWGLLPEVAREALQVELRLVSIVLDARALPVWLGVASVGQPDLTAAQEETATASEEWIRESLTLARLDLDLDEEWLRRRLAAGTVA